MSNYVIERAHIIALIEKGDGMTMEELTRAVRTGKEQLELNVNALKRDGWLFEVDGVLKVKLPEDPPSQEVNIKKCIEDTNTALGEGGVVVGRPSPSSRRARFGSEYEGVADAIVLSQALWMCQLFGAAHYSRMLSTTWVSFVKREPPSQQVMLKVHVVSR